MKSRWLLRAFCVWTVFVFVVLIKNMLTSDDAVSFRIVHSVIGIISIAFAFACWPLAKRIRGSED